MIYSYILCLLLESTHGMERSLSVAAYSMPEYSEPYYTYTHNAIIIKSFAHITSFKFTDVPNSVF